MAGHFGVEVEGTCIIDLLGGASTGQVRLGDADGELGVTDGEKLSTFVIAERYSLYLY